MTARERDKAILDKCFKMTKKGKKEADRETALRIAPELKGEGSSKDGIIPVSTRNELMLMAKERGIKNFRVLNKEELMHVTADGITQQEIDAIVAGAVARWKSGWGKGKDHKE